MTTLADISQLRCGATYRATTGRHTVVGEYLGMETPHGDRAILIRHAAGTDSIDLDAVTSIQPAA